MKSAFKYSLIVVIAMSIKCTGQVVALSFDQLFPATSFTQVLDECMKLYGELEQARTHAESQRKAWHLYHKMPDRIEELEERIDELAGSKAFFVEDDLEYLVTLLRYIEVAYEALAATYAPGISIHVIETFKEMRAKLELLSSESSGRSS